MKRSDRLYALVETLRAESPRPQPTRSLAERLEVGVRTVERDIRALQRSGVPIRAGAGRAGGYRLDHARTPPPVSFTQEEAIAVAAALQSVPGRSVPGQGLPGSPFEATAGAALRKLAAALQAGEGAPVDGTSIDSGPGAAPEMPRVVAEALSARRVLRIGYVDESGVVTEREVEPLGYVISKAHWLLVAWCRRRDALRPFRADRITSLAVTAEVPEPRRLRREDLAIPYGEVMQLTLG
jgi:predicted DNA-binding transcriptional regulator YafY